MKILYLPVKKQWFTMEDAGVKTEEYRRITPFWVKRLLWDAGTCCRRLMSMDSMRAALPSVTIPMSC